MRFICIDVYLERCQIAAHCVLAFTYSTRVMERQTPGCLQAVMVHIIDPGNLLNASSGIVTGSTTSKQ